MKLNAEGPLVGVKVLEVCEGQEGPYCGALLSDLGAMVIKVESKEGDYTRQLGPFKNGESSYFISFNRGKWGISLDLGKKKAQEIIQELASECDIFIENLEPGAIEAVNLNYKNIKKVNSSIIYGSISCYGRSGPLSKYPGNDVVAEAMSGHTYANGRPDGPPIPLGIGLCQHGGAAQLAWGVLCAYFFKMLTGQGQYVEVSMADTGISMSESIFTIATMAHKTQSRRGGHNQGTGPYGVFQAMDGSYATGVAGNDIWRRLTEAIGRPELHTADGWATNLERGQNCYTHMIPLLNGWGKGKKRDDIVRLFRDEYSVPAGPCVTHKEILKDTHYRLRKTLIDIEQPKAGKVTVASAFAGKMTDSNPAIQGPAPLQGEHNLEILTKLLGYTNDEVKKMYRTGILFQDLETI